MKPSPVIYVCTYCGKEVIHETGCPSLWLSEAGQTLASRAFHRGFRSGYHRQPRVESDPSYLLGYRRGLRAKLNESIKP